MSEHHHENCSHDNHQDQAALGSHGEHHHVNYSKIYYALLVLFIISWLGPEMTHNKIFILLLAFGIALIKAIIVAGYFMHLAYEKKYMWYAFITALGLLFLFVAAVAPDIMKDHGQNWKSHIVVKAEDGYPKGHPGVHGEHAPSEEHAVPAHE